MKIRLLLLPMALLLMWAVLFSSPLQSISGTVTVMAQNSKDVKKKKKKLQESVTVTASKGTSSKGGDADANITQAEMPNVIDMKMDLPISKGGGKGKGGGASDCEVQLDNWTSWNVKMYINGNFRGTLSGGNESYLYYTPGKLTLYARADFSDGSYLYWGPKSYTCLENQYVYFKMTS